MRVSLVRFFLFSLFVGFLMVSVTAAQPPRLVNWGAGAGARTVRPRFWAELGFEVSNRGDTDTDSLLAVYFSGQPELQYGRRVWVPAGGKRFVTQLVRVPSVNVNSVDRLELKGLFFPQADREVVVRSSPGELVDTTLVTLARESSITAIASRESPGLDDAYEMILAGRIHVGPERRMAIVIDSTLPGTPEAWDGVDHLVLGDDRVATDQASLAAVRSWVMSGGRLLLILDRMSPETVEALLGNDWTGEVIDTVGLTSLALDWPGKPSEPVREFEDPVKLVRVVTQDDVTVRATINGWPALFDKKLGRGQVTFVAAGPRSFIRPRVPSDPRPSDGDASAWYPLAFWRDYSEQFFPPRAPEVAPTAALQQMAAEQIGYRIPPRSLIGTVLAGCCGLLLVGGLWGMRRQRLEHLAWFVPLVCLLTGTSLAAVAMAGRTSTPPALIAGQYAALVPTQSPVDVRGVMATYSPDGGPVRLGSDRGGVFQPPAEALGGTTRRMVWTDLDKWSWQGLSLPAGVTVLPFRTTMTPPKLRAKARFGPSGLRGEVQGGPLSDVLIATDSTRVLGARLDSSGRFQVGREHVLPVGSYVAGTLLTDEQQRHQKVYADFQPMLRNTLPQDPVLLAWKPAADLGFIGPEGVPVTGGLLVTVPVEVKPAPAGTAVVIPGPFLSYRPVDTPSGESQASPFNYRKAEWQERSGVAKAWQRVQFPRSVLPLEIKRLIVTIQIKDRARRIVLMGTQGKNSEVPLETREEPVGTVTFEMTQPEYLKLDTEGGLIFGLRFGRDDVVKDESAAPEYWQVISMQVEAEGIVGSQK